MSRARVALVVAAVCLALIPGGAAGDSTIRYGGLTLRSGQILVADSYDAMSVLMTLSLREFTTFTHSGILAIEDGYPVVYEAYGRIRPWHKGPPTDATDGRVQRSTLADYIGRHGHVEIYGPPDRIDRRALVRFARRSYRKGVPFDAYFSPGPRSYYCAELVAHGLAAAGGSPRLAKRRANPSLAPVRRWLGIEAEAFYSPDMLIEHGHYRGAITHFPSRTTYRAYRAAKREIHRRFTGDQKLGNIFYLSGRRPKLRGPIRRFIDRVMAAFPGGGPSVSLQKIRNRVRVLAARSFGPRQPASLPARVDHGYHQSVAPHRRPGRSGAPRGSGAPENRAAALQPGYSARRGP